MVFLIALPLLVLVFLLIPFLIIQIKTRRNIYPFSTIPFGNFSLVLGAGLKKNGTPSDILADRVDTAVNLLKKNKTEILFLSGSGKSRFTCEPEAMKILANSYGINNDQMCLDYSGYSTFHSCLNIAKFCGNSEVIIVTQMFHLPRAIWLAQCMGICATGTPANRYKFSRIKTSFWYLREIIVLPFNFLKLFLLQIQKKD